MILIIILWLLTGFFSFGILGLHFLVMKKVSEKPWNLKMDETYRPRISIIVPTYNEEPIILLKLRNLIKINYPKELTQIIVVDSNSSDGTVGLIQDFMRQNTDCNIELIIENSRRGKSAALNEALKSCKGDIVIVSDADCFLPQDILKRTLPFLSDPSIGAISGPKEILNVKSSRVVAAEKSYLNSMNLIKLGESKIYSTILFEGGFSAFKKDVIRSFDPFNTGSDDCGSIIDVIRQGYRAIMLPEGVFFTSFPITWKERFEMKIRRAGQLVKVLKKYVKLLIRNEIKNKRAKLIIFKNILLYVVSPMLFPLFILCSVYLALAYPQFVLILFTFFIPKLRAYLVEAILGFAILIVAIFLCLAKKNFSIWKISSDRILLSERVLVQKGLL